MLQIPKRVIIPESSTIAMKYGTHNLTQDGGAEKFKASTCVSTDGHSYPFPLRHYTRSCTGNDTGGDREMEDTLI